MHRRKFLHIVGNATGGLGVIGSAGLSGCATNASRRPSVRAFELEEVSVAELRAGLRAGRFTAQSLTKAYLREIARIDRDGPRLNAVIELNPEAGTQALALDAEWRRSGPRGPWHGIPVLLKDNLDTGDRMTTTAGSLALEGSRAPRDSFVAERLRAAGAVLLGKTNLSEWANFRGSRSISGWSGRGGQTHNPYCTACNPSGSSSGSAVAASASLCAVAVGTETNGSIVSPASYCGVVGIKPTVGLVSRAGIIPISSSQDTAGPLARTVADAAALLGLLAGPDPRDPITEAGRRANAAAPDYERSLDPGALRGARLGVPRSLFRLHRRLDPVYEAALGTLREAGAELVEPVELPSRQDLGGADYQVMVHEFKDGLNAYFHSLGATAPVRSVEDLIAFNEEHRDRELLYFGQETLIEAQTKGPLTAPEYLAAKARCQQWSARIAAVFADLRLDAVVAPTTGPAHALDYIHGDRGLGGCSTYAAVAGLPHITVPCGHLFGLPVGLSFFGPSWTEARLIGLAFAFEQARPARPRPAFAPTLEALAASAS